MKRLNLLKSDRVPPPLHLHLYEINLEKKFKNQKTVMKQHNVPLLDYFKESLKRLNLKIPSIE